MKHRFLKIFGVTLIAVLMAFTVFMTACKKQTEPEPQGEVYSETYTGAVSAQSYGSVNEAAAAFVDIELSGNATPAVFVGYEKKSKLTESEQDGLALPDSAKTGLISVEKGRVNYMENTSATLTKWKNVYVLNYGTTYKYYTPALTVGESLTKSYYDSVFNASNYRNVTMEYKQIVSAKASGVTMTMQMSYTYKIADDAVELQMTMSVPGQGTVNYSFYFVEFDNSLSFAMNDGSGWIAVDDLQSLGLDYSSIDDIYSSVYYDWQDQSYFVKTESGFKIADDKINDYLINALAEQNPEYIQYIGDSGISADTNYYIKEGKISKASIAMTINIVEQGVTVYTSSSAECLYSNYGTTTVTVPDEVKEAIGID